MFLSVIIPVFNTEAYLADCIQSILEQDLPKAEFEIICVNDGSVDGSLACLQSFSEQGLEIINQKNAGVCVARNRGFMAAKGDYVWFVDSDDFLEKNILSSLKEIAEEKNPDRIIIDHYTFLDHGAFPVRRNELPDEMQRNTSWYDSVPWRSVIKRSYMIEHGVSFQYPELSYGEDALFLFELTYDDPITVQSNLLCYYHRDREGSLSSSDHSPDESASMIRKMNCNIREAEIVKSYFDRENPHSARTANRLMSFLWGALYAASQLPRKDAECALQKLKRAGLFPYEKPGQCQIQKSYVLNRGDTVERLFDFLYTNLHTRLGYCAMRIWNEAFRLKSRIIRQRKLTAEG